MSLPDTAEYWNDVKSRSTLFGNDFRHAQNIKCGHNHNIKDTVYSDDVTCHACKKIISETNPEWMKEGKAPENYYLSNRQKKEYNKRKEFNEKYGLCTCGSNFVIRKNSKENTKFLGCSKYPICKNTKSII